MLRWRLTRGRQNAQIAAGGGLAALDAGCSDRRSIRAPSIHPMVRNRSTDLGDVCRQRQVGVTPPRHTDVHGSSCVSGRSTTDPGAPPERAPDTQRSSQFPRIREAQEFNKSPPRGTPRYRFAIRRSGTACGPEPARRQGFCLPGKAHPPGDRVDRAQLDAPTATRRLWLSAHQPAFTSLPARAS